MRQTEVRRIHKQRNQLIQIGPYNGCLCQKTTIKLGFSITRTLNFELFDNFEYIFHDQQTIPKQDTAVLWSVGGVGYSSLVIGGCHDGVVLHSLDHNFLSFFCSLSQKPSPLGDRFLGIGQQVIWQEIREGLKRHTNQVIAQFDSLMLVGNLVKGEHVEYF